MSDVKTLLEVAFMFQHGRGVVQDLKEAANCVRLAADQGDASAQFHLGDMYKDGLGVVQNYVQAHMWYNLSAANGYPDVFKQRDEVATKMTSAQIAQAQELAHALSEQIAQAQELAHALSGVEL